MLKLSSTGTSGSIICPENTDKKAENALMKRSLEMIEQEKVRVSAPIGQFFRQYRDDVWKLPVESVEGGWIHGEGVVLTVVL